MECLRPASAEPIFETVFETGKAFLGSCGAGLPKGPGLSREQAADFARDGPAEQRPVWDRCRGPPGAKGKVKVQAKEAAEGRQRGGQLSSLYAADRRCEGGSETPLQQFCREVVQEPAACKPEPLSFSCVSACTLDTPGSAEEQKPRTARELPPQSAAFTSPKFPFNAKRFKGLSLKPGDSHVFVDWAWGFLGICSRAPVCLAAFLAKSLKPASCHAYEPAASGDIWPVPPPLWRRWSGPCNPGAKRRRRARHHAIAHALLSACISVLNWLLLGYPKEPPPGARAGAPISPAQSAVQDRLLHLIFHFLSPSSFGASTLGRSSDKFDRVAKFIQELPIEGSDVDLHSILHDLHRALDPYGKPPSKPDLPVPEPESPRLQASGAMPATKRSFDAQACKPLKADRIKWKYPPSFDASAFLVDPVAKAAFHDPDVLRLPPELWPSVPKARVHASKAELLKLAQVWDRMGALHIFREDEISDPKECVGLFTVPKDEAFDRLILNPVVINSRMQSLNTFTRFLSHGSQFCLLHLEPNELARCSADDLCEFYYTMKVSVSRCKRNAIGLAFQSEELTALRAYSPSKHWGRCFLALASLAMGDSLAVELAQQSHFQVLRTLGGCMLPTETVSFRRPFPRSKFLEFLCIDDHIGVQLLSKSAHRSLAPARDTAVFKQSGIAYEKVGLVRHPEKQKRGVTSGTFLGADLDGIKGLVSAPRDRVLVLMLCTAEVCRKGSCTPKLLSMLLGCWIHVVMFRRPALCVLDSAFAAAALVPSDRVIRLSSRARNELVALSVLGPLLQTDLRTSWCPRLFCMDASPSGAALCSVEAPVTAVQELWRHTEQRGYYTRLEAPASAALRELGEESLVEYGSEAFCADFHPVPATLSEGILYDCLEICRGSGSWSLARSAVGLVVHDGVDVQGPRFRYLDLARDEVFHELLSLALRRVVRDWHGGPPCLTFGTLRRPRLRSKLKPAGFNPDDPTTALHNRIARRVAFIFSVVALSGLFFSVEQPGSSVMFRLACFARLLELGARVTRVCYCSYGTAFQKASQWLHNKPWMLRLPAGCSCPLKGAHFVIQGTFTKDSVIAFGRACRPSASAVYGRLPVPGESVASFSAAYPVPLVGQMAAGSLAAREGAILPFSHAPAFASLFPQVSADLVDELPATRPSHEDPEWISELADSLPFQEDLRYKFHRPGHINVLEARMYKTFQKRAARLHPDSRIVGLLDSRVTLGAVAKGRSSSPALCRILQGTLPYTLGGGLYSGNLHVYSSKNRADGPSRNRPVEAPSKEVPLWYQDLCKGDHFRFDCVVASSRCSKLAARWLRLLLLLGGDIERNPGPSSPPAPRGPLDLTSGFTAGTVDRMAKCLQGFKSWVASELGIPFPRLCLQPEPLALALRGYGLYLYSAGFPRYLFVYAITAVQDVCPAHRMKLTPAWQIDKKWQAAEPGECRPVISAPIVEAMTAVGLCWAWPRFVGTMLIGFLCMLHPSEYLHLTRADLLLPGDMLSDVPVAYVHVRNPKTARFARRQHCRLEDRSVLSFITALFGALPFDEKLYPGTKNTFRSQWNAILHKLGIPFKKCDRGVTPGVLRGSGATHLYLDTEDLVKVAWRGRWARQKTVEFYLQEVAAQIVLQRLPLESRCLISDLRPFAAKLISFYSSPGRSN